MPKQVYSVELAKPIDGLEKITDSRQMDMEKFKQLNQEEREIYMDALGKKMRALRRVFDKLIK